MIEIKPVQDRSACGTLLSHIAQTPDTFAMAAYDGDTLLAAGAVMLAGEYALLLDVVVPEQYEALNLAYGMGKSLLNFIDRRAVTHVICENDALEPLLKRLRFHKTDKVEQIGKYYPDREVYYLDLTNYFTAHC